MQAYPLIARVLKTLFNAEDGLPFEVSTRLYQHYFADKELATELKAELERAFSDPNLSWQTMLCNGDYEVGDFATEEEAMAFARRALAAPLRDGGTGYSSGERDQQFVQADAASRRDFTQVLDLMFGGMGVLRIALITVALTTCALAGDVGSKPLVSGDRKIPAGLEWNKEIFVPVPGTVFCRIKSGAAISVTLIANRSYQAVKRGDAQGMMREDLLFTSDHPDGQFSQAFDVSSSGSYWFIIENRSRSKQHVALSCEQAENPR